MTSITIKRELRVRQDTLTMTVSGGFTPGMTVYGYASGAVGTVVSYSSPTLVVELSSGAFAVGESVSGTAASGLIGAISEGYVVDGSEVVAILEIDEDTVLERELMGMDKLTVVVNLPEPVTLLVGDYVELELVDGAEPIRYSIRDVPEGEKISAITYRYEIVFYGLVYELYDKMIMDEGVTTFSYTGTPLELLELVVDNLQEHDVTWAIGDCALLEDVRTFSFAEESCRVALTRIAQDFGLEFYVTRREVDEVVVKEIYLLEEVGTTQPFSFLYGRNNALYSLTRKPVDEPFATVWYGYGGTKNLPASYRSGLGRLTFDESPVMDNVPLYGRKEGSVTFEDIYPKRVGTVTGTPAVNKIVDSGLDFDINEVTLVDGSARVVFTSGDLNGNEFVIQSYDHTTKTITLNVNTEESGYVLPNDVVKPAVDDTYVLVGIEMPGSYVTEAEAELKAKVLAYVAENSAPKVSYDLSVNEKYIRQNGLEGLIVPGDRVRVTDAALGVDADLRIQRVSWPLVNPAMLEVVISESVLYTEQERIVRDVKEAERQSDSAQAGALYARQVADEVNRAAILQQFRRTYVGERAVLSGAFVAGNPEDGAVAGMDGTGSDADSIRFWAGSDYDGRATAPFRVQQDGRVFATAMTLLTGCKVGDLNVTTRGIQLLDYSDADRAVGGLFSYLKQYMSNVDPEFMDAESLYYTGSDALATMKTLITALVEDDVVSTSGSQFAEVLAGVFAAVHSEISDTLMDQIKYSRGLYGLLSSSHKNLGAKYEALRYSRTDAALEAMTRNDYQVIIIGVCTGGVFPLQPDHGFTCEWKNFRSVDVTLYPNAPADEKIVLLDNSLATSFVLTAGFNVKYRYDGINRRWYQLNRTV